jgi:hypothetical protein
MLAYVLGSYHSQLLNKVILQYQCEYGTFNQYNLTLMVPILHMMVPTLHMIVPTITLFGTLNFIYYLNLIYIKNR